MSFNHFLTLNNGNKIPFIGVGSGFSVDKADPTSDLIDEKISKQIKDTIELPGFSHLDTAQVYKVYPEINDALSKVNKPRNEFWVTDKFWPGRNSPGASNHNPPFSKNPVEGLESTLKLLNLDYVDLYLLHHPDITVEKNGFDIIGAWKYMETLYKSGKAKNIGISNFRVHEIKEILENSEIKPQVNQLEFHPYYQQLDIVKYCQENDILIQGYSPLAPITKFKNKDEKFEKYLGELAKKYNTSESQILYRWSFQKNVNSVTYSKSINRVKSSLDIFGFELSSAEVDKIAQLGQSTGDEFVKWVQT